MKKNCDDSESCDFNTDYAGKKIEPFWATAHVSISSQSRPCLQCPYQSIEDEISGPSAPLMSFMAVSNELNMNLLDNVTWISSQELDEHSGANINELEQLFQAITASTLGVQSQVRDLGTENFRPAIPKDAAASVLELIQHDTAEATQPGGKVKFSGLSASTSGLQKDKELLVPTTQVIVPSSVKKFPRDAAAHQINVNADLFLANRAEAMKLVPSSRAQGMKHNYGGFQPAVVRKYDPTRSLQTLDYIKYISRFHTDFVGDQMMSVAQANEAHYRLANGVKSLVSGLDPAGDLDACGAPARPTTPPKHWNPLRFSTEAEELQLGGATEFYAESAMHFDNIWRRLQLTYHTRIRQSTYYARVPQEALPRIIECLEEITELVLDREFALSEWREFEQDRMHPQRFWYMKAAEILRDSELRSQRKRYLDEITAVLKSHILRHDEICGIKVPILLQDEDYEKKMQSDFVKMVRELEFTMLNSTSTQG